MLNIYTNIKDYEQFVEDIYEKLYQEKLKYNVLEISFDVLLLNKDKYTVEDIYNYLEFYKYKPMEEEKKISIINNFDLVDNKSQNKLLRLFEENEENHILITNNLNKILSTIKSRATIYNNINQERSYQEYPKRYWDILQLMDNLENVEEIDFYLKLYDNLNEEEYKQAYLKLIKLDNYNEQVIYEIIQYSHKKIGKTEQLLELQQKLFSKTNKKLQIENYLLQRIKENGNN
ncbi:MAG: hypothetical protein ACK5HR_06060 [Mycoplasmatales bacterium]